MTAKEENNAYSACLDMFGHFPTNSTLDGFCIRRSMLYPGGGGAVCGHVWSLHNTRRESRRANKRSERGIKGEGNVLQVDCPYWRRHATESVVTGATGRQPDEREHVLSARVLYLAHTWRLSRSVFYI